MERKDYTPTKLSKLTGVTNPNLSSNKPTLQKVNHDYSRPSLEYNKASIDFSHRSANINQMNVLKEYQVLKVQVKQLQTQNRQLSNDIEKLKYQKNIHENKYLQKVSYEQDTISQFQKEKNYQLELLKIKNDEEANKVRRQYDFKLDQLHRQLRSMDYHNRQHNEQNSYLDLKTNQLKKRVETLQTEIIKFRQSISVLADHINKKQFGKKKLMTITEELERQKCQMEAQIHVLLDIQAQKSRAINTLSLQLRNSQTTERSLHQKLSVLTDNFTSLEEHIAIMKERLISTDLTNQQLEKQLHASEYQLSEKDNAVLSQKDLEVQLRKELQIQQARELRREKQILELIAENERLVNDVNLNRQQLHELCIIQGIQI